GLRSLYSTEPIANALNGFDHRRSVAQFFPERANHDIHHIASTVIALFPNVLQQGSAWNRLSTMPVEILHDAELKLGQARPASVHYQFAGCGVEQAIILDTQLRRDKASEPAVNRGRPEIQHRRGVGSSIEFNTPLAQHPKTEPLCDSGIRT